MNKANVNVKFFLNLARMQAIMNRRLDSGLGGLGFNEFIILYNLSQAPEEKLRRIDLAEKVGLTASGVTRQLLPMEKIGLVRSGENEYDARVRTVILTTAGKRKFFEGLERMELLLHEIMPSEKKEDIKNFSKLTQEIMGNIYLR